MSGQKPELTLNSWGKQEEFRLIFGLQQPPFPYSSSVAINMRDAVPRNTDLSLNLGAYVLEKDVEVAWGRVGGRQGCTTVISPPASRGTHGNLCGAVKHFKTFMSRGASLSIPPVLGLWGSRVHQDMPGRHKANQPAGVN